MKLEIRQKVRRIRQLKPLWPQIAFRFFYALLLWTYKVPFRNRIYIKIPISCRLGNQMFMTAFGETLKAQLGGVDISYYTYGVSYYLQEIDPWIFSRFKILTFYIPNLIIVNEPLSLSTAFKEDCKRTLLKGNVLLSGYFENINLIDLQLAKVLHKRPLFVSEKIYKYYGDLSKFASIHVRRGDFVSMGVSIGADYYLLAMSKFPNDTKFIVISDDIQWCKENMKSNKYCIIFADKHVNEKDLVYLDLYLPSLCTRGNILSCSSFSWWGSALSVSDSPIRVMPRPWWTGEPDKPLYFENAIILDSNI